MFDIGWSELLVIGVVALVVIGPKDLPRVLKTVGIWVRKARAVSREFQSSVEQMVREAELEDVRKEIQKATTLDFDKEIKSAIDPKGELDAALKPPEESPTPAPAQAELPQATPSAELPAAPPPEPAANLDHEPPVQKSGTTG